MRIDDNHLFEFGSFRLDPHKPRLTRNGEPILLPPKAMETLIVLLERAGKVVEREELMQAVWGGTVVEDANLTVAVSTLRKTLAQHDGALAYIETVPRVGYRFTAEVQVVEPEQRISNAPESKPTQPVATIAPAAEPAKPFLKQRAAAGWLAGVLLALCSVGVFVFFRGERVAKTTAEIKSIAVLPLQTLGQPGDDESLRLRLTDALITQLSMLNQLAVRPTSAVLRYARTEQEPLAAGRKLEVDAVLEGRVQREGAKLRVTMQMLRVSDGAQVWAQQFDEAMTDTFALQDAVAAKVVQSLTLRLSENERARLAKRPTENLEAYENYLKGRYFLRLENQGIGDDEMRLTYFKKALELDPDFELAWVGLADGYQFLYNAGISSQPATIAQAREAVDQALRLNPELPEAQATLAVIHEQYDWDWEKAELAYRRALKLDPNNFNTRQRFGWYLAKLGRFAEAEEQLQQALRLDPHSVNANFYYGTSMLFAHRYEEAAAQLRKTIGLDANYSGIYWNLARIHHMQGNFAEAIAALRQALLIEEWPAPAERLGKTYAAAGYQAALQEFIEHMKPLVNRKYTPYNFASQYARVKDKELTLHWLSEAFVQRDRWLPQIKVSPEFDFLRADQRFQELLRQMKLDPQRAGQSAQ